MATRQRRKLLAAAIVAALLLLAFVLPPLIGLNRFHNRIAESVGRGIGRPVGMSSVKMHLLPRPGFEIADFVIEEDPAFGAEPILRCAQVTAYLRLLPLWQGRLEIARIAFDEPSLNLVRNLQGRWNFDSLLSQAAQIPKAPTAERHPRGLPRFPYIDATNARINFKIGDEKMPFSLLNADLAVWLENPGEWRIQFAAQPVRTDLTLDLASTGILRLDGTLRHAASFSQMPAQLHAEWSKAPLGQLSRIVTGSDSGWRGTLDASADIAGTTSDASLKVIAKGTGIHRVEFEPIQALNLDATCEAQLTRVPDARAAARADARTAARALDAITCLVPTGTGHLLLTGAVHGIPGNLDPALLLEINHTPVATAFDGIRLLRAGFAPALLPAGTIDGSFTYSKPPGSPETAIDGHATVNDLTIAAPALPKPLVFPTLHLATAGNSMQSPRRHAGAHAPPAPEADPILLLEAFSIKPAIAESNARPSRAASKTGIVPATLAPPGALAVSGTFSPSEFSIHIGGQSDLGAVAVLGKEFGLLRNRFVVFSPQGTADVDLTVHGPWMAPLLEQPGPTVALEGQIRVHNAELTGDFLAQPLQIVSAQAAFGGNRIDWTASSISYGLFHADGNLSYPTFCESPPDCLRHFTLHLNSLDAAEAQNAILGTSRHPELMQQILNSLDNRIASDHSWPALTGTVLVGTLQIGSPALAQLPLHDLNAEINVDGRTVQIKSLTARTLDGALHLTGVLDVTSGTPRYQIDAQLDHASATSTATLFQEKWGAGSLHLAVNMKLSGFSLKDLASSATGTFQWDWANGGLPLGGDSSANASAAANRPAPLLVDLAHFDSWKAEGTFADSTLTLRSSQILKGTEATQLAGTITFGRQLNLATPGQPEITGTLPHPQATVPAAATPAP